MRGSRSIFTSLFENEPPPVVVVAERKGRSEVLLNKRNELLICRYYYHARIMGLQYAVSLRKLEGEMYIAERTIINTLEQNRDILKALIATKPTVKYFRDKFPAFQWPEPTKN